MTRQTSPLLGRGDRLPAIVTPPPGPRSRELSGRSAAAEAPGINAVPARGATLVWDEARGANVADVDGNVYLDLTSGFGVAAIGHRHPRVVAAVRAQAGRLLHGLGDVHSHPGRAVLAERLAARAPVWTGDGELPQVFFGISGSEAVEIAVKTAMLDSGRSEVVAFEPSYHGLTLGSLALTSRREFRRPFSARLGTVHRLPFAADPARLAGLLDDRREVACLVYEPIVGREGIVVPPAGWLAEITGICRRAGVAVIADEVFTGFGRCGAWFATEVDPGDPELFPDLLVCGKALGGGLPLAAVVARREQMAAWQTAGEALHTATFVANPVAVAAALATLDVLEAGGLIERVARRAPALARRLAEWPSRFDAVDAVRGRGWVHAAELCDREAAATAVVAARARGVLLLAGGPGGKVLQLVPPLVVTARQLDFALSMIEEVLADL